MARLHRIVFPVLVAIGVAVASPVSAAEPSAPATDPAAAASSAPTVDVKQAKYILHVDGMT